MLKKILLVDDDPGEHVLIVPVLSKAGFMAVSAKMESRRCTWLFMNARI